MGKAPREGFCMQPTQGPAEMVTRHQSSSQDAHLPNCTRHKPAWITKAWQGLHRSMLATVEPAPVPPGSLVNMLYT
jgi:hypothetical protein